MTPKEKAKDIFTKYMVDLVNELGTNDETYELNKKFALIAVEESLEWVDNLVIIKFLNEVKKEIEKL